MNKVLPQRTFENSQIVTAQTFGSRSLSVNEWREVGIEITATDSFRPNFFLVINRNAENIRIPYEAPEFKALLDYFATVSGFDWQPLVEIRFCGETRYFPCWSRDSQGHPQA